MQYRDIQRRAIENSNFRKVLFTNKHSQVVLMSILPGEDIGREVHDVVDRFWFSSKGMDELLLATKGPRCYLTVKSHWID